MTSEQHRVGNQAISAAPLDNYRFLARNKCWFNQRLYEACEKLSDEERQRDRGAFFHSIHLTLTHLVLADKLWLQRFVRQTDARSPPSRQPCCTCQKAPTTPAICTRLARPAPHARGTGCHDRNLAGRHASRLPAHGYALQQRKGVLREHPAWQALSLLFNHQTHHRGQATTLLAQAGAEVGVTDLIALV